jgi:hypothetical protein
MGKRYFASEKLPAIMEPESHHGWCWGLNRAKEKRMMLPYGRRFPGTRLSHPKALLDRGQAIKLQRRFSGAKILNSRNKVTCLNF